MVREIVPGEIEVEHCINQILTFLGNMFRPIRT